MMPTLVPTINLGEVISLILTGGGFLFGLGKVAQTLNANTREVAQLRADFHEHAKADAEAFRATNEAILRIAMRGE